MRGKQHEGPGKRSFSPRFKICAKGGLRFRGEPNEGRHQQRGSRIRWKENRRLKKRVCGVGGMRGKDDKKGRGNKSRGKEGLMQGAAELRNLSEEGAGRRQVHATGSREGHHYLYVRRH